MKLDDFTDCEISFSFPEMVSNNSTVPRMLYNVWNEHGSQQPVLRRSATRSDIRFVSSFRFDHSVGSGAGCRMPDAGRGRRTPARHSVAESHSLLAFDVAL